jgi:CO/xanthine dehydrogenase FAD-binding subunit
LNFARPAALSEALELLEGDVWTILAGGTDYYPSLRSEVPRSQVLDISQLRELRGVTQQHDAYRIGALTTWTDIVSATLPPAFLALQQAAREVGSVQIQNRASVGGNLCNASPAADGVPPLLILDASVELHSHSGTRVLPLQSYIQGNRRTARQPDELLSAILIPREAVAGNSAFMKLGARRFLVISIGMVAARLVVEDDVIQRAAVAIGSCSEVACRLSSLEKTLQGQAVKNWSDDLVEPSLLQSLQPISDIRATAEYRSAAAAALVRRTVAATLAAGR